MAQPVVDGELKATGFSAETAQPLNNLELSGRPGLRLGETNPRLTVAYRADLRLLRSKPLRHLYEGHRAEAELEIQNVLTVFLGGGRRFFREGGRTRWEVDGDVGSSLRLGSRAQALLAAARAGSSCVD